jgi:tetratricopeptide (TPR) repeat protein
MKDLQAYLDGQAVTARQGSFRYLAGKFIRRNKLAIAASALLCTTVLAGVGGVAWQAHIATVERRKAEARADDLRKLSNSLLSELDEAIKQLPGSTGAQHLLVTRVLEHLDRMASDAQGDRQIQLDLVSAYTRLGNIQGNGYEQNLGDFAGASASLGKARTIAESLVASDSTDRDAIRALASVEQTLSEVLWVNGRTLEAIPVLQEAVKRFDALVAAPHASPALIADAAGAYGDLGDELGHPGMDSMNNPIEALGAYQKSLSLVNRVLSIDPEFMSGKPVSAVLMLKIGTVEMEIDPSQAVRDLEVAQQRVEALPGYGQGSLPVVRLRSVVLLREANALARLGRYSDAVPLFTEDIQINSRLAAADPQDWRAAVDLEAALNNEAACFEDAADPALSVVPGDRRRNLSAAEKLLTQAITLIEMGLRHQPHNDSWRAALADAQVRLGTIQSRMHPDQDSSGLAKKGLSVMKEMTTKDPVSPAILDHTANAFLTVEPAFLRDPPFAVLCAEREVAMSHGKTSSMMLTLAKAYRASGQIEKSCATAQQGLSLLPALPPGSAKPRVRKLLEIQAQSCL